MFKKLFIFLLILNLLGSSVFAEITIPAPKIDLKKRINNNIYTITAGASKVININFKVRNVAVGNADIADVIIISPQEILINAKKPGITTLTLWDALQNYDYQVVVNKGSENIYFKIYKINNIPLVQHSVEDPDRMIVIKSDPIKETIDDLKNILSSYLEPNRFAVNPWTNSVMVVATHEEHKQIAELIEKLDVKEKQVLFKVEIYELKLTNSLAHELELFYQKDQSTVEYKKFADGLRYTFSSGAEFIESATHVLKYLQSEGHAKILANPKILSLNGRYSFIHAGEKIPIVHTDAQGNQNVEYLYTGVILGVIPKIDNNENINCWLSIQVSSIAGYSPQNGYPTIGTREMVNEVRIQNKGMLILGGLIKETDNANYYKVPILGDLLGWIPIIGSFFKNEESETITTELVITLKPEIVFDENLKTAGGTI